MYIYIYQTELKNILVPCPVERDDPITPKHGTDGTAERICRTATVPQVQNAKATSDF